MNAVQSKGLLWGYPPAMTPISPMIPGLASLLIKPFFKVRGSLSLVPAALYTHNHRQYLRFLKKEKQRVRERAATDSVENIRLPHAITKLLSFTYPDISVISRVASHR